ncbi:MAG: hypothetical protein ABIK83_07450 [Candidatus Zixiibacteriota bacterium]
MKNVFSESYRKARRQYALFAALLLSWELIGLRIDTSYLKNKYGVTILSPEAVPIVLIALLFYFCYRIAIEWHQQDHAIRSGIACRIDNWVSHSLALIALGVYVIQRTIETRLADKLGQSGFYTAGAVMVSATAIAYLFFVKFGDNLRVRLVIILLLLIHTLLVVGFVLLGSGLLSALQASGTLLIMYIANRLAKMAIDRWAARRR